MFVWFLRVTSNGVITLLKRESYEDVSEVEALCKEPDLATYSQIIVAQPWEFGEEGLTVLCTIEQQSVFYTGTHWIFPAGDGWRVGGTRSGWMATEFRALNLQTQEHVIAYGDFVWQILDPLKSSCSHMGVALHMCKISDSVREHFFQRQRVQQWRAKLSHWDLWTIRFEGTAGRGATVFLTPVADQPIVPDVQELDPDGWQFVLIPQTGGPMLDLVQLT